MLTLSRAQVAVFEKDKEDAFVERALNFTYTNVANAAEYDRASLRSSLIGLMAQARKFGYTTERSFVALFCVCVTTKQNVFYVHRDKAVLLDQKIHEKERIAYLDRKYLQ